LNGLQFSADRWGTQASQNSKATFQQSATAPTGFTNSVVVTSSSAYSPTSSDYFWLYQTIEGFNIADLGWGSASAQTVTLSFWVRASVTGTYSVRVGDGSRSYVSTYTVNSANTYEYKTITIAGDQSGTWNTTNGTGIQLQFDLGCGSTRTTSTTNAWQAGDYQKATGSVSLVATSGATLYITGVQLEAGTVATSFDWRPYGTELALCQRYFQKTYDITTAPGTATNVGAAISRYQAASNAFLVELQTFTQVSMRAIPTVTAYSCNSGASGNITVNGSNASIVSMNDAGFNSYGYPQLTSGATAGNDCRGQFTASAEL
jgi:hypothetical protein